MKFYDREEDKISFTKLKHNATKLYNNTNYYTLHYL